jgi:hypothetical protein
MHNATAIRIEELLVNRPFRHNVPYEEHHFKKFFKERGVRQSKLAALIGVTPPAIFLWFSGRAPLPPAREEQLVELKQKIEIWERKNGRVFGT